MKRLFDGNKPYQFFDAWEQESQNRRNEAIRKSLHDYIQHARQLTYYKGRLASYDAKAEYPLAKVSPLLGDELKMLLPPYSRKLVLSSRGDYSVFQSGGTTGFPKTALFSAEEMQELLQPNARGYYAVGLVPDDRVGNLFAVGSLYMTFIHINNMLERYGCTNFAFSNHADIHLFKQVVEKFNINVLAGVGSIILKFLRELVQDDTKLQFCKVFYGGEHMYDADKQMLKERFGVETVLSPGYGSVDTWYIGYQCQMTATGVHHAHDDQCYIEIVDEETGKHCEPGEVGMLYATALPRCLTPIVRYRVGDRARWLKDPCACGRTTPVFELLGRGDDMFRIGFDTIDYSQMQAVIASFGNELGLFQMERRREDSKDRLILRIETDCHEADRPDLAQRVEVAVLLHRPVLKKNIEEGIAWPVRVELVSPRTLPLNPRTGKLLRVIDLKS